MPRSVVVLVLLVLERRALPLRWALVLVVEDLLLLGDALRREIPDTLRERDEGGVLRVVRVESRAVRVRGEVEVARHDRNIPDVYCGCSAPACP